MTETSKYLYPAKARALVFQVVGITDIILAAVIAFIGPSVVGGEPVIDMVLWIAGAVFFLSGIGIWWWGRRLFGQDAMDESGPVQRRRR